MARYIDADLIEYHDSFTNDGEFWSVAFKDDIDNIPTADVVGVVRCKDCKYFVDEGMYCVNNIITQFDHFFAITEKGEKNERIH